MVLGPDFSPRWLSMGYSHQERFPFTLVHPLLGVVEAVGVVPCRCAVPGSLAAPITPEASLKRLVLLVNYLAAWKLLPNVSRWVLHTVERGYRIQFGSPPPRSNRVVPTLVDPGQTLVMEREVDTLLRKEAIEVVPTASTS